MTTKIDGAKVVTHELSEVPDLLSYDLILVNTSGGKDSSVMGHLIYREAVRLGIAKRLIYVHATFREEWEGTEDLVRRQCEALGESLGHNAAIEVVTRGEGLLDYTRRRGMWPSSQQRWCTSDFKRAPIDKVITRRAPGKYRRARVLNCMGLRAQESPARAKREPFSNDGRRSNGRRKVDQWLPIFDWTEREVWDYINTYKIEQHPAYKAGMPRLSCVFCIFAPKSALMLAGKLRPDLLAEYVAVEKKTGHQFRGAPGKRGSVALAEVQRELEAGANVGLVEDWKM